MEKLRLDVPLMLHKSSSAESDSFSGSSTKEKTLDRLLAELPPKARDIFRLRGSAEPPPQSPSGWTVDSTAYGSVDSTSDPFELQRQQLLIYIEQAKKAKRHDELATLEASLRDIEALMSQGAV